jgi:uncharacterized protein YgiM (DUF1202 family)
VLPIAVQYGMPINEFWYGDTRLLSVYQKAFLRNQSYTAWLQGQYNSVAFGIVLNNAFGKKGAKAQEYPNWKDPIPKPMQEIITKENLENKFRQSQASQNNWLHSMLHKK